jgi:choice-of-anchor B domain-containing protein
VPIHQIYALSPQIQGMNFIAQVNEHANDKYSALWGYTAPDGREYAILGVRTGTAIIDITDNNNVKEVAFIKSVRSLWREMKTYSHYAYVVTDNADTGIEIIDLAQLPSSATLVSVYKDLPMSHTITIDEPRKLMYLMGGSGETVVILSLEDPLKPKEIARFGSSYVHDAYIKNGRAYLSEIMSQTFSIWDIADTANPKFLKRVRDKDAPAVSFHNSWTTEDEHYLVTTEETQDRTVKIWDISDLNAIKVIAEWLPPNRLAHNVQIKGNYAYFSSYGGGIRILDLSNPLHPNEVAFWTRSEEVEKGFVGMWACYPFFKSGKVIGSDIENGLIVVDFEGAREAVR